MTRKDYIAIAQAIEAVRTDPALKVYAPSSVCELIAEKIADVMRADNSRFDRQRFLEACGVN